jgi:hypothetical protein
MLCIIYVLRGGEGYDHGVEWHLLSEDTSRYLGLNEMTDPHFGHHRDGHGLDDLLDHVGITLSQRDMGSSTMMNYDGNLALAIRATPPSERMSAGTRSSAMTAHAPASSAIRAFCEMAASE